jgi:hypothetical protein
MSRPSTAPLVNLIVKDFYAPVSETLDRFRADQLDLKSYSNTNL